MQVKRRACLHHLTKLRHESRQKQK
uniref:Uncharacterized protein n=1 Tax=Rhizophora mucronata TaxID=61149 RepID=A0A2P2PGV3_RHIMU